MEVTTILLAGIATVAAALGKLYLDQRATLKVHETFVQKLQERVEEILDQHQAYVRMKMERLSTHPPPLERDDIGDRPTPLEVIDVSGVLEELRRARQAQRDRPTPRDPIEGRYSHQQNPRRPKK